MNYISETVYAGVLGKIIGVYLGRPVEGKSFNEINSDFGEIYYYQNRKTGAPLIVPDDDISGTFAFYRALEDNQYDKDIKSEMIGKTWLNYIIEDKTILWWGGLSRSTEHTAYLRLKNGIPAPMSGSEKLNGKSISEQIGAQIFIDAWSLVNLGNPELAVKMAREAAMVSHDGIAVDAACFLAAMEALASEEKEIETLIDKALSYVNNQELESLVCDIRNVCERSDDWHQVRDWIAEYHGYDKYAGSCPMVTNHLVVLMALIMGGDDFQKSIMIATSAGWDTDCNSGNVGCINGIRLGLKGIDSGADLRAAVADRMYIVTSDGGACISDAVIETRKILRAREVLYGEKYDLPMSRFNFEFKGSRQGFLIDDSVFECQAVTALKNDADGQKGLCVKMEGLAKGVNGSVVVDTFVDTIPKGKAGTSYFDVICSPNLYETQTVKLQLTSGIEKEIGLRLFVLYYDEQDELKKSSSKNYKISPGRNQLVWSVPSVNGHVIYRLGLEFCSEERVDGNIWIEEMDWNGAPENFSMGRAFDLTPTLTPWVTNTTWLKAFVSSAKNFCPCCKATFCISHPEKNGVVTIGTADWSDYLAESVIQLQQNDGAGIVGRAKGHRRYYAAILRDQKAEIVKHMDEEEFILGSVVFPFKEDVKYRVGFAVKKNILTMIVDGKEILSAEDKQYCCGGAGFVVDSGAFMAEGFCVKRLS